MPKRHYAVLRLSILIVSAILLTSCNMLTRLSELKNGPQVSAIANPTARPKYRPVSMPMPMPKNVVRKANSLWRPGARAFFRDQRASDVGDILTVKLSIEDSAALANKTTGARLSWKPRIYSPQMEKWLFRIKIPTLIISGSHDNICPLEQSKLFNKLIESSRLAIIENCGHLPHVEKTEEYCDLITNFIME